MGGFWSESVPEEVLSRDEAQRLFKRLFRMLQPQRGAITRQVVLTPVSSRVRWTSSMSSRSQRWNSTRSRPAAAAARMRAGIAPASLNM